MIIVLHLWSLQKILQKTPHISAAPVDGVNSPHRVVGNSFVHRVPVDNSLCFLQNIMQVCVLWIIQHQYSLLQSLHGLCRLPVQNCAYTHSLSLSCACLFCMLLVQHAFHLWLLVQQAFHLGLLVLPTTSQQALLYYFFFHPCKL